MKHFRDTNDGTEIPWYIAGLAFECSGCGRCCSGPEEGYVWATEQEFDAMAEFLKMTPQAFRAKYVRRIGRRFSLVEQKPSNDCIFLKEGKCTIYEVRPKQCRTWPFWHSNIETPDDWSYAGVRCEGINRGKLHSPEHVIKQANATRE